MNNKIAHNLEEKQRTNDINIDENVTFDEMFLSDTVLKGLHSCGYIRPSPIQLSAIPLGRCGLDLIVQAKSGTGKTCVFTVVALEMISVKALTTQVLVVAPTREIAVQICQVINSVGSSFADLKAYTFIGGIDIAEDKAKLSCCHIAIGTPGRLNHMVSLGHLNLSNIRLLVLDEADQLLTGEFKTSVLELVKTSPLNKQILACSATYPKEVTDFLDQFMRSPSHVRLGKDFPALIGVRQFVRLLPDHPQSFTKHKLKFQELLSVLSLVSFNQCLVFSNSQLRAESVCNQLKTAGYPATFLTGNQMQKDRLQSFFDLCSYKCRILVSTDLSARGLDSEHVNLVINLDIPVDQATYLHRIGRAGRFGSIGVAISLACEGSEWEAMRAIVNRTNVEIKILPEKFDSDTVQNSSEAFETVRPLDENSYTLFMEEIRKKKFKHSQLKGKTKQDQIIEKSEKYLIDKEYKSKKKSQRKAEKFNSKNQTTEDISKQDQLCMKSIHSIMKDYYSENKFISFSHNNVIEEISEDMKNLVNLDIHELSSVSLVKKYPTKSLFDVLDKYIAKREKSDIIESSQAEFKNGTFDKIKMLQKVIDGTKPLQTLRESIKSSDLDNDLSNSVISSQEEISKENVNKAIVNDNIAISECSSSSKRDSETNIKNNMQLECIGILEEKLNHNIKKDEASFPKVDSSLTKVKVSKSKQKIYDENTGYGLWEPVFSQTKYGSEDSHFYSGSSNDQVNGNINFNDSSIRYQNKGYSNYYCNNTSNVAYSYNSYVDMYVQSAQKFELMMEYTQNLGRMSAWIARDNENKLMKRMRDKNAKITKN